MRPHFKTVLHACNRVTELGSSRSDRQAYHRSGLLTLGTIDLLLAVWDGVPPQGPGGTGDMVRAAAEANIPVIWIASEKSDPVRLITGRHSLWRFEIVEDKGDIEEHLQRLVLRPLVSTSPHGSGGHGGPDLGEKQKADAFEAEQDTKGKGLQVYSVMKRLMSKRPSNGSSHPTGVDAWQDLIDAGPKAPILQTEIAREVEPLFRRADRLAVYYADNYRSAYVITYIAAMFAVVLALLGLIIPHDYTPSTQVSLKAILVALELLIVGAVVGFVITGIRHRWHEKWMDYRAMAEMLRHIRFLAYLGAHRRFAVKVQHSANGGPGVWTNWMVDRIASRIGLPDAVIDQAYLSKLSVAIRNHEVETQLRYHAHNTRTLHRMNRILHGAGDWCFYITAGLLAAFLIIYAVDAASMIFFAHAEAPGDHEHPAGLLGFLYASKATVGFLAAALPALGAALSGIRFTGEFETFAGRSEAMALALFEMRKSYNDLVETPDFDFAAKTVVDTATILASDIEDWKTLYTYKRLSLPA